MNFPRKLQGRPPVHPLRECKDKVEEVSFDFDFDLLILMLDLMGMFIMLRYLNDKISACTALPYRLSTAPPLQTRRGPTLLRTGNRWPGLRPTGGEQDAPQPDPYLLR